MYSFRNDYSEGAHPKILEALMKASLEQSETYGKDRHSLHAAELIRNELGRSDVDIHFLAGGTQTNLVAISAFLRPHEAAVSAVSGHINVHETGSIEATGHKVVAAASKDGKLTPKLVKSVLDEHTDEHMVKPKLVYLSDSTEIGTIYTKSELTALSEFCKANRLYLYLDGARLGSALTARGNDLTLRDLAQLTDAFYIGGTKNGALLGEALVICNPVLKEDFRYLLKQRGAILAKGMVLGVQFEELFQNHLYFELAEHANEMAGRIRKTMIDEGFDFLTSSPTNQLFPIMSNSLIEDLCEKYEFELWCKLDDFTSVIRIVTSWATPESAVEDFIQDFQRYLSKK